MSKLLNFIENRVDAYIVGTYLSERDLFLYAQKILDNCDATEIQISELLRKGNINDAYILNIFSELLFKHRKRILIDNREDYLSKIKNLDSKELSHRQWNYLRFITCYEGLLLVSHYCRDNCKKEILKTKGLNSLVRRFSVLIEDKRFDEANELLDNPYLLIYKQRKNLKKTIQIIKNEYLIKDDFSVYIENKNVAIVGPGPDIEKVILNNENAIIRFAYQGDSANEDILKPNISYYNKEATKKILANHPSYLHKLDFVVGKGLANNRIECKYKEWNTIDRVIPFGTPNAAQYCILDLKCYNVKSISLYNMNMFLSKQVHSKGYEISKFNRCNSFAWHDIEGNFVFLKNLLESKIISCDEILSNVLSLSVEEYLRELEQL